MGRRWLKFDLRKNYEITLKLSLPLAKLKVLPLHMSLPSSVYANAPVSNGKHLGYRLRVNTALLPIGVGQSQMVLTQHIQHCTKCSAVLMVQPSHAHLSFTLILPGHLPLILPSSRQQ